MGIGMTLSHLEYEYSQRLLEGAKKYVEETGNDFLVFSSEELESNDMIDEHQRRRLKENG